MTPRSARCAAALLPCVNLLLMMLGGAGLATAARLRWDPSASIPLRLALPQEYRVAAGLLTAGPLALLLLAMLAQAGLHSSARRRLTLLMYAVGMVLLMIVEVAAGSWLGVRVYRFATEDQLVPELLNLLRVGDELRTDLNKLLHKLDRLISLSEIIENILRKWSPKLTDILYSEDLATLLQMPKELFHRNNNLTHWMGARGLAKEIFNRTEHLADGLNLESLPHLPHLQDDLDTIRRMITDIVILVSRMVWLKGRCFIILLEEIPSDLPCNVLVGAACVLLCGVLQPLAALLAWLAARTGPIRLRPAARNDDTLLLSSVRSTKESNIPRCLRPISTGDKDAGELPRSTDRLKDKEGKHSLRTAPRSHGWQLEPGVGWTRG